MKEKSLNMSVNAHTQNNSIFQCQVFYHGEISMLIELSNICVHFRQVSVLNVEMSQNSVTFAQ